MVKPWVNGSVLTSLGLSLYNGVRILRGVPGR